MINRTLLCCGMLILASCSGEKEKVMDKVTESSTIKESSTKADITCPIFEHKNWHAWIDKLNKDSKGNRLNITGEVSLPNPGYTVTWQRGPMDRRLPPSLRLSLSATPPDGMVIQVITPTPVSFKMDTPIDEFRSVIILCGDKQLAVIKNVTPR